jgi:UDP-N-acetylglucosamine 2-epimerase (non-hydrolysing)
MKKIVLVSGTRPEIIKVAPLYLKLKENKKFETQLLFTGQHIDLAQELWKLFKIEPKINFTLSRGMDLNNMFSELIFQSNLLSRVTKPDLVIVQGDTTSALAVALASFHQKIPVAHLEAGLRTWDNGNPYPEEANRRMIDSFADLLFAPTELTYQNLMREKCPGIAYVTGNTIVDAVKMIEEKRDKSIIESAWHVLWTMHRRESRGKHFVKMVGALKDLSKRFPEMNWVFPVHPSPEVRNAVASLNGLHNVELVEPMKYNELLRFISNSSLVVTDSGGIQEEAVTLKKHCLVMRDKTERPEALESGWVHLIGRERGRIVQCVTHALDGELKNGMNKNPFGNGDASEKCVKIISKYLK